MTEYSRSSSYPCGWGLFLFPCAPIAPHFPPAAGMFPRPIAVLTALRCPKKSSHYSFARFFRPLRILRLASSAAGGARLRIPTPRDPLGNSGISPIGGASLLVIIICTARRRGVPFAPPKGTKSGSRGTDSPLTNPFPAPCCAGYERRFSAKKPSVLHADGLNKVSQMHLPPPNLPRFGGGERPPFLCKPPAPLTITMGQRLGSLQVTD